MKKYFFSNNCYFCIDDDDSITVFRIDEHGVPQPVKLSEPQLIFLKTLLENNGQFCNTKTLYSKLKTLYYEKKGIREPKDHRAKVSNLYSEKGESELGLKYKIPEINCFYEHSNSSVEGGYKLTIPDECIVDDSPKEADLSCVDENIWYNKNFFDDQQRDAGRRRRMNYKQESLVKQYLTGIRCSWHLIFDNIDHIPVRRDIIDTLEREIAEGSSIIVLTSAGGEGKTTILMQLLAELYCRNETVFWHRSTNKYALPQKISNGIFIIDDPYYNTELKRLFEEVTTSSGQTVVIASRSNIWTSIINAINDDDIKRCIKEIELPKISESEASNFALCISINLPWVKRSLPKLKALFKEDSYGFLYASMLMATNNADTLEQISKSIIERISKFSNGESTLKVLAAVVFAEQAGTPIKRRDFTSICKQFDVDERTVKNSLRKEVVQNGALYQTRHDTISKLFFKYLFDSEDSYLLEDDQEAIVIAVINAFLIEVDNRTTNYQSKDIRVNEISNLFVKAFSVVEDEDTENLLIQRLIESCRQHAQVIIERIYFSVTDKTIRYKIANGCYDRKLSTWNIYTNWVNDCDFDFALKLLCCLCSEMNAPENVWRTWAKIRINHFDDKSSISKIYIDGYTTLSNCPNLISEWAAFEIKAGNIGVITEPYSARWILFNGIEQYPQNPSMWREWAIIEEKEGNIGEISEPYSVRWILFNGVENNPHNPSLCIYWANIEEKAGKIGDNESPYTAKWIIYNGLEKNPYESQLMMKWAIIEESYNNNIGNYETPNSAAWIYKEACINHGCVTNSEIWMKWTEFSEKYNDSMSDSENIEFTPSKILKCACVDNDNPDLKLWRHWAYVEESLGNIGDYDSPYTAKWIINTGLKKHPYDTGLMTVWADLEIKNGHIGNYEEINSAAWIYKEACINHGCVTDSEIWFKWAEFAQKYNVGEYTPSKILKHACIDHNIPHSHVWIHWANIEENLGNIGSYNLPYSAAWILKEACFRSVDDHIAIWGTWALFIKRHNDKSFLITDYPLEAFLENVCINGSGNIYQWMFWAIIEEIKGNIGDYSKNNSAAWIYREGCINHVAGNKASFLFRWAQFAHKNPMYYIDGTYIDAKYVIDYAKKVCSFFNNIEWAEKAGLADFEKEIGYQ